MSRAARGLAEALAGVEGVRRSSMFGCPAYFAGRRMFACALGSGVGLKLPAGRVRELIETKGAVPFVPYGRRPMAEWVEVRQILLAGTAGRDLLREAAAFVSHGALGQGPPRE